MIRPAPERDAAIVLQNVQKRFGTTYAVRDLDLVVPRGSLCGFLGPNGAGKSTTIRMIMSIIYPDSGAVRVLDGSALAKKDQIGYLPEERGLYRTMRVVEFLAYIGTLKGLDGATAKRRALEWLERIDLPGQAKKKCQELSKGMQQKVQFIASVLHDPELLILDEPFSGLDPMNAMLMSRVITDLHDAGKTIIFSTHQMRTAEALCDRVVLINRGEKLLDAPLAEVRTAFDEHTIIIEPQHEDSALMQRLRGLPGVSDVRRDEENDAHLLVRLNDEQNLQAGMVAVMAFAPMHSVAIKRTSLDFVFLKLVGDSGGAAPIAPAARVSTTGAPRS
ncbi:MAG: ATP-binding cassette domain-containing protein [Phycisphaerae bacterium]|nr:ATP-binding cassette domain-containing protein [Phycisphaerae bacterium]